MRGKVKKKMPRENLKEARQKAGMTQKQVAEYLGITSRAYQHIENGNYLGKIEHWDKLEDLFCIHQRELRKLFTMTDKTINVHISNIRQKIKKITDTEYIETVWGLGFKLASL